MTDQNEKETNLPEVADAKTREVSLMGGIIPKDFSELTRFASLVHQSRLAPKGFDSVEKVAIGLLTNMELGRPIITGLQDLAIINGRCGIYGDASLAMVTSSGKMDGGYPKSTETGTPFADDWTFTFTVKRVGRPEETGTWTWIDAKRAGFDDPKTKDGRKDIWSPWTRFTRRMMQWKARNFVMRDNFGDILKGMKTVEDLHDLDPIPMLKRSDGSFSTEPETETASDLADKIKENEAGKGGRIVDVEFKTEPLPEDKVTDPGDKQELPPYAEKQNEAEDQNEIPCPYCKANIKEIIATYLKNGWTSFVCPNCYKQGLIKNGLPVVSVDPVDETGGSDKGDETKSQENLKVAMKKQDDLMTHGIDPALAKTFRELTSHDAGIFWRMRERGLDLFFGELEGVMNTWPKEIQGFVMAKCKNIASKHPEFMARLEVAMAKKAETEDHSAVEGDDTEDWNGLKACPKMENGQGQHMNIPKIKCKTCEDRPGCIAWGGGMEQF